LVSFVVYAWFLNFVAKSITASTASDSVGAVTGKEKLWLSSKNVTLTQKRPSSSFSVKIFVLVIAWFPLLSVKRLCCCYIQTTAIIAACQHLFLKKIEKKKGLDFMGFCCHI
jgi:hypothetical protein